MLNDSKSSIIKINIFGMVFRNLFRKVSSLFGQNLIKFLKCFRAFFYFSLIAKKKAGVEVENNRFKPKKEASLFLLKTSNFIQFHLHLTLSKLLTWNKIHQNKLNSSKL